MMPPTLIYTGHILLDGRTTRTPVTPSTGKVNSTIQSMQQASRIFQFVNHPDCRFSSHYFFRQGEYYAPQLICDNERGMIWRWMNVSAIAEPGNTVCLWFGKEKNRIYLKNNQWIKSNKSQAPDPQSRSHPMFVRLTTAGTAKGNQPRLYPAARTRLISNMTDVLPSPSGECIWFDRQINNQFSGTLWKNAFDPNMKLLHDHKISCNDSRYINKSRIERCLLGDILYRVKQ